MVISMCETIMCGWLNSGHLEIVMWGLCWHFDHWQLLGLDWVSCQIHVHIVHLLSEGMRDVPKFWGAVFRSYCWSWPIWPWCCWSRCVSALCWFLSINLFKHVCLATLPCSCLALGFVGCKLFGTNLVERHFALRLGSFCGFRTGLQYECL